MRFVVFPRRCRHSHIVQLGVITFCGLIAIYYYIGRYQLQHDITSFSWSLDGSSKLLNNVTCVRPVLELWNDRLRQLFAAPQPLTCSTVEQNWVYVSNSTFYIAASAVDKHGPVNCEYIPIHRGKDDFEVLQGDAIESLANGSVITSDVFRVKCTASDGLTYRNVHVAIAPNEQIVRRSQKMSRLLSATALRLNIIMFGFDSVSRMTWMRNLPKSYEFLVNTLGAVVMKGYNVVGDGTPQALLPILTGLSEPELPEARRGFALAKPVDGHPWIWNSLRDVGYVTQWGEESPWIGTFTYRMLGFQNQPVDHYLRTFYLAAEPQYKHHEPNCLGSVPRHQVMMQWARDFIDTYQHQLKFSFVFHSEYTHEANSQLQWADDDLLEFLRYINDRGHLNNSLLVLMSDHGARFQNVRITEQGKYEERMPFMALRVPEWLSSKYPEIVRNLQANADRLTTPFDLHETFIDILDYRGQRRGQSRDKRGISFFREISAERSCADAGVEPHWCTCLSWQSVSVQSGPVQHAVDEVLSTINRMTSVREEQCARLTLANITAAVRYVAATELLKFRRSSDTHGRIADLSDDMQASVEFYQVTFVAKPSGAIYEATVKRMVNIGTDGQFLVDSRDISRINRYGSQPDCVATQLPHLRPYCYCIN